MKSVSTAFKDALASKKAVSIKVVGMKRRYWSQASNDYLWEAAWTEIPQSQVIAVSPITGQLDTERLNEFKVSNVTITFKNDENKWRHDNPAGYFGKNASGLLYPFEPYWTKFRVQIAVDLADGTVETVTMFTGLAVDYIAASDDSVQVVVQGLESLLINTNAENVSTTVTGEVLGTANGILTDFTTAQPGVGVVIELSVAGIVKTGGKDYTVNDLNDPNLGATFHFDVAPASGTVRASYKFWKQDKTVEELVADLLTLAGVSGADQLIDPVIFPTGISQSFTQDTYADWLAGTRTTVDITSAPGDILVEFLNSDNKTLFDDFSSALGWTIYNGDASNVKIVSGQLSLGPNGAGTGAGGHIGKPSCYKACSKTVGAWQFTFAADTAGSGSTLAFQFMGGVPAYFPNVTGPTIFDNAYLKNGYYISVTSGLVQLVKIDGVGLSTTIGSATVAAYGTSSHTVLVARNAAGVTAVYYDGSLVITAVDTTYTSSSNVMLRMASGFAKYFVDNVYIPSATCTGNLQSQTLDALTAPSAWGHLTPDQSVGAGGSVNWFTRSSVDGSTWDAYVAISSNGQVTSAQKRYLQVKPVIVAALTLTEVTAVHSFNVAYTSGATLITIANFTGKTCYDAMQDLGKFANYEWGFTADEDFFFRSKDSGADVDIVLDRGVNMSSVQSLQNGYDRVFSQVEASYGSFVITRSAPSDVAGGAGARFKAKLLQIDGGDIIIAADADIASGIAGFFLSHVTVPRRRFKAPCKFLPHVDLSDVAKVSFAQNLPRPAHYAGDTSHYAGEVGLQAYGDEDQIVSKMLAKIVGYRHDADNAVSEFDLEEIIA